MADNAALLGAGFLSHAGSDFDDRRRLCDCSLDNWLPWQPKAF